MHLMTLYAVVQESWFTAVDSICGGEGVGTTVGGGAGDGITDGIG